MMYSVEELIAIAQDHWPADLETVLRPDPSPQVLRFQERWRHQLGKMEPWESFVMGLEAGLPDLVVGDITATVDASLRCAVSPREEIAPVRASWTLVGCMSLLAPVYMLYAVRFGYNGRKRVGHELLFEPLPHEIRGVADVIAERLEAAFGISALPREVAETPVPLFVDPHQPPSTTLFHALFTSEPLNLP